MPHGAINHLVVFPGITAISHPVNHLFQQASGGLEISRSPFLSAQFEPSTANPASGPCKKRPGQHILLLPVPSNLCLSYVPFRQTSALPLPCWLCTFIPILARMQHTHKAIIVSQAWWGLWGKAEHLSAELSTQQPALFSFEPLGWNFSAQSILMGIFPCQLQEQQNRSNRRRKNVQIAKHGKFFRMERAQMDSPLPFAKSWSDSELMCFMVEAWHPATAVGPRDRTGTRFEIRHFSITRDQRTGPVTSKVKDKYSFHCSLEIPAIFIPENGSLFP